MSAATEVHFVRHGESVSNAEGRWQGHGDSPLNDTGERQAARLAERLGGFAPDVVVASDLHRARETGRAFAGPALRTDPAWREIDVGRWEGLLHGEVRERFPEDVAALEGSMSVKVGGGESWTDLGRRVRRALHGLQKELEPGQRALVFTHGGVVAALVSTLFGVARRRPRRLANVANTALTSVRFEKGRATLLRFNDTMHLEVAPGWREERRRDGATVVALGEAGPDDVPTYDHGKSPLPAGDLDVAVAWVAERHGGERVALRTSRDAHAHYARTILSPSARVEATDGVTHVVASERGASLADFNAGAALS